MREEVMQNSKISIVIPTKNEEYLIEHIISSVRKYGDEILLVDGHSKDKTREIAEKMGVRVVLDNGKGKGDGLRVGIKEASGDIILFIDADGSHIPEDIPLLIKPVLEDKADMVLTSRMTGGSEELHGDISKFIRIMGGMLITLIINYRWNVRITDTQNGFRAIKKQVALDLDLKEDGFPIETEMIMKALKKKYRIVEIPSRELKRVYGDSRINLFSMWYKYVWCVIKNLV